MPWSPAPCSRVDALAMSGDCCSTATSTRAGLPVEAHRAGGVADVPQPRAPGAGSRGWRLGGDLAGDHRRSPVLTSGLAGHAALRVLATGPRRAPRRRSGRHLVGMAFGDGLGGEQVVAQLHGCPAPSGRHGTSSPCTMAPALPASNVKGGADGGGAGRAAPHPAPPAARPASRISSGKRLLHLVQHQALDLVGGSSRACRPEHLLRASEARRAAHHLLHGGNRRAFIESSSTPSPSRTSA